MYPVCARRPPSRRSCRPGAPGRRLGGRRRLLLTGTRPRALPVIQLNFAAPKTCAGSWKASASSGGSPTSQNRPPRARSRPAGGGNDEFGRRACHPRPRNRIDAVPSAAAPLGRARPAIRWPWPTSTASSPPSRSCAWSTHPSCRPSRARPSTSAASRPPNAWLTECATKRRRTTRINGRSGRPSTVGQPAPLAPNRSGPLRRTARLTLGDGPWPRARRASPAMRGRAGKVGRLRSASAELPADARGSEYAERSAGTF